MSTPDTALMGPAIRPLDREECVALLRRNHLGRIAYSWRNQIDIEPIHYVFRDDGLFARTSSGEKYRVLAENFYRTWPVAFEVDEAEGLFRWRSVVVHGNAYLVQPAPDGVGEEEWQEAVAALRELIPETFTPDDPVPERDGVFRIAVQEISGREATPSFSAPVGWRRRNPGVGR